MIILAFIIFNSTQTFVPGVKPTKATYLPNASPNMNLVGTILDLQNISVINSKGFNTLSGFSIFAEQAFFMNNCSFKGVNWVRSDGSDYDVNLELSREELHNNDKIESFAVMEIQFI